VTTTYDSLGRPNTATCYNNMLQPFVMRQRRAGATSCLTGTADGNDVGYFSYTFPSGNETGSATPFHGL